MRRWLITILLAAAIAFALWEAKDRLFLPAHRPYDHDRFGTQPAEHLREFEAFVSSFDGADDGTGDGLSDIGFWRSAAWS